MNANCNISSMEVNFRANGNMEVKLNSQGYKDLDNGYPTSVYITAEELPLFLDCMTGESEVYPYFSDISYLLRVHTDGFKFIKLSSAYNGTGKFIEYTFTVPNKLLSELHAMIRAHIESPSDNLWSLSEDDITRLSDQVKPVIRWDMRHYTNGHYENTFTWIETIEHDLNQSLIVWSEKYPSLLHHLDGLSRIAHNYSSFGDKVTIHLSFDSKPRENLPDSYYFDIRNHENKKIMNGGIIFHSSTNEYGIHT